MSIYDDAFPDLQPGNTREVVADGHVIHVTAGRESALHTGRRRYMVECLTCKQTLHEATTGPEQHIRMHTRKP